MRWGCTPLSYSNLNAISLKIIILIWVIGVRVVCVRWICKIKILGMFLLVWMMMVVANIVADWWLINILDGMISGVVLTFILTVKFLIHTQDSNSFSNLCLDPFINILNPCKSLDYFWIINECIPVVMKSFIGIASIHKCMFFNFLDMLQNVYFIYHLLQSWETNSLLLF